MMELSPSILSADFARLGDQVNEALATGITRIHCDIMDGRFVPNISFGPGVVSVVSELARQTKTIVEVHLMIVEPERYIGDFVDAGGNLILVHVETCPHLNRTVQQIHQLGADAGVVLNPATPLDALVEILPDIEQVLIMTVNPGFGGQEFIAQSLDKLRRLKLMLRDRGLTNLPVEVDGGIHTATIAEAEQAGATVAVAGSAIFNRQGSVADNIRALREACQPLV